jgi:uncharacterized membrane protein
MSVGIPAAKPMIIQTIILIFIWNNQDNYVISQIETGVSETAVSIINLLRMKFYDRTEEIATK